MIRFEKLRGVQNGMDLLNRRAEYCGHRALRSGCRQKSVILCLFMPKFHYTNFTETSPKLPRDKSPRLVYDLSPTCLGEVSGK